MTSDTTTDDYVQLFDRRVPVPALTLLLRLEDEGYDIRVDGHELCIKPTVPAHEHATIARLKPYLVILVTGTMQLLERERRAELGDDYELV